MLPKPELIILKKKSKYAGLAYDNGFGLVNNCTACGGS
jgi:hypothetical protein